MNAFDDPGHSESDFFVSTERTLLDHRWIIRNLLAQSWADCWTHERLVEAITNSLVFGVYQRRSCEPGVPINPIMVGFARIITDGTTYSLLCDVVIDEAFRGRGLAKFLVATVTTHPQVKNTVSLLRTAGAQKLYERFGYHEVKAMRRIPTS